MFCFFFQLGGLLISSGGEDRETAKHVQHNPSQNNYLIQNFNSSKTKILQIKGIKKAEGMEVKQAGLVTD